LLEECCAVWGWVGKGQRPRWCGKNFLGGGYDPGIRTGGPSQAFHLVVQQLPLGLILMGTISLVPCPLAASALRSL
jgi:hypothetical protein